MLIDPDTPPVAAPVANSNAPDAALLEVPVDTSTSPLFPLVPAFPLWTTTLPPIRNSPDALASPACNVTLPPVAPFILPAEIITSLPTSSLVLVIPTEREISPLLPSTATPVATRIAPVFLSVFVAVPVVTVTEPLRSNSVALSVCNVSLPLPISPAEEVTIETAPPVADSEEPPFI